MESGVVCCQTLSAPPRIEMVDGSGNKNGTRQCHVEQPDLQFSLTVHSTDNTSYTAWRALYSTITALTSGHRSSRLATCTELASIRSCVTAILNAIAYSHGYVQE